jgi:L-ascorbate metabolism protein UlaG (beta-lactamase superfamily)
MLPQKVFAKNWKMKIDFIRHATLIVEINRVKILVDPMLSSKGAMDPVKISRNVDRIPLVDLPIGNAALTKIVSECNAVVVTHTHRDHWDAEAQQSLPKGLTVICQPSDSDVLRKQGFTHVQPVNDSIDFEGLKIYRTGGQHGTGDVGLRMGHVSGFVIEFKSQRVYIAGDTIWCTEVQNAIEKFSPDVIVLNSGAAQFDEGGPITMNETDVLKVIDACPNAKIICVHMDTVNHCSLSRKQLTEVLEKKSRNGNWMIPFDGQAIELKG